MLFYFIILYFCFTSFIRFPLPIVAFHVVISHIFTCIRQYMSSAELVLGNHLMVKLLVITLVPILNQADQSTT